MGLDRWIWVRAVSFFYVVINSWRMKSGYRIHGRRKICWIENMMMGGIGISWMEQYWRRKNLSNTKMLLFSLLFDTVPRLYVLCPQNQCAMFPVTGCHVSSTSVPCFQSQDTMFLVPGCHVSSPRVPCFLSQYAMFYIPVCHVFIPRVPCSWARCTLSLYRPCEPCPHSYFVNCQLLSLLAQCLEHNTPSRLFWCFRPFCLNNCPILFG